MSSQISDSIPLTLETNISGIFSPEVKKRAQAMLYALLERAGIVGNFNFASDAPLTGDVSLRTPRVFVKLSGFSPRMLSIGIVTSGKAGSAIKGGLRVPLDHDPRRLIPLLEPVLAIFNEEHWKSILDRITPEDPPVPQFVVVDGGTVTFSSPPPRNGEGAGVRSSLRATTQATPLSLVMPPAAVAPPPVSQPSVVEGLPPAVLIAPIVESAYEKFLIELLQESADGVFQGKGIGILAKKYFPDKSAKFHSSGLIRVLQGSLKLVTRVGEGLYQVEDGFAKKYLPHIKFVPMQKATRKTKIKKVEPSDETRHTVTPLKVPSETKETLISNMSLEELLEWRENVEVEIAARRKRLDDVHKNNAETFLEIKELYDASMAALEEFDRKVSA